MNKIKKLIKKLNNRGSSIIMVVVSIAFISIIVGALLSTAGYTYKLKMQDLNAKDNYYYVEQAMQEIYAGVGTNTVNKMKDAYNYTIENMVQYDLSQGTYKTLTNEQANIMFKKQFLARIKNDDYFKAGPIQLADTLEKYITNDSVKLDKNRLIVESKDDQIAIKNITLTRTQEYSNSSGSGSFTQTISADIVIGEPDFTVNFNNLTTDYSKLFDFALIADMGIEVSQNAGNPLSITGNVYAAADYYNKKYNQTEDKTITDPVTGLPSTVNSGTYNKEYSGKKYEYTHSSVTSKYYTPAADGAAASTTLYNLYAKDVEDKNLLFDGENVNSAYSGLYVDGSAVSILADTVIVPGTLAVMNGADLTVYGKNGTLTSETEVWTDNLVLGGKSLVETNSKGKDVFKGSKATFRTNLFVKDDTELNSNGSQLKLYGGYYGYSNSTVKDNRSFVPTVDESKFKIYEYTTDADGKTIVSDEYIRGHYNSSSIVINGEQSTLDLSNAKNIYLAGRAYIELSKYVSAVEDIVEEKDENGVKQENKYYSETFKYVPTSDSAKTTVNDFKTGESISVKSNQLAYIPISKSGSPKQMTDYVNFYIRSYCTKDTEETDDDVSYTYVELSAKNSDVGVFGEFFPASVFGTSSSSDKSTRTYVPCVAIKVPTSDTSTTTRLAYYYDFETAYNVIVNAARLGNTKANEVIALYDSVDEYSAAFASEYVKMINDIKGNPLLNIEDYDLVDITDYEDFELGDVKDPLNGTTYSSGAITVAKNNTFSLITKNDSTAINTIENLLYNNSFSSGDTDAQKVLNYSKDLEKEYNYVKWNLGHIDTDPLQEKYVDDLVNDLGEDYITPINKYVNMDLVLGATPLEINPSTLQLSSGAKIWVSKNKVIVDGEENITGIIVTADDVEFSPNVKSFEGIIIAGGKIYIRNNLMSINSSAETCRTIMKECILNSNDTQCKSVLSLFKEYENSLDDFKPSDTATSTDASKSISTIDYSDVCSMTNWMKYAE